MEGGPQKTGIQTEEHSTNKRNEMYERTENHSFTDMGANTRKQKAQIKFSENHDPDVKKREIPANTVHSESLKNGKHQPGKHVESEWKGGEAFQRDSQSFSSDTSQTWKNKSICNNEPPSKKTAAEVRGSESSLYSKVSTCTSLNPVMENATESASDTNEISLISRESSPRESIDEALKSEKAFIEYVMSLPSSASLIQKESPGAEGAAKSNQKQVTPALTSTTKVGLDHLDNLCKLMEQLSELKETNSKLQKRVQYLEDLKTLHDMHKEIRQDSQYGSENVLMRKKHMGLKKSMTSGDYVKHSPRGSEDFTEIPGVTIATTVHTANRDLKASIHRGRPTSSSAFDGRRRERSKSVGHEDLFDGKPRRIFPKWSKVKEALGWERALPEDSVKHQQLNYSTDLKEVASKPKTSGKYRDNNGSRESAFFKGNRRVFTEDYVANLGIPYYSDYAEKEDESPSDSLTGSDLWKHNLNFRSSSEDISRLVDAYHTRRDLKPKSLTIERDIDAEQAFAKFDKEDGKKSHKSPWGRVKTIIERRRDSLKRRHFRRCPEPEPSSPMQARDMDMAYTTHSVDDLDYQSHEGLFQRKSSDDQLLVHPNHSDSYQKNIHDYPEADKCRRKCRPESTHWKEKQDEEEQTIHLDRNAPSALRCSKSASNPGASQFYDIIPTDSRCISGGGGEYPTPSSSPQFHRKSRWVRMKKALRGKKEGEGGEPSSLSMPASPNGVHEATTFDFEDNDGLYDEGGEEKFVDSREQSRDKGHCRDVENCPHPCEMSRVGSDSYVHKLSLSSSAPISDIMMELQRNLSDDFSRKIVEWERIRSFGGAQTTSPKWDRKNSEPKSRSKKQDKPKTDRIEKTTKPKIKDLSWLEKELQKIEKEKLRLSKEKEKYEERAIRLERLRQTVLNANSTNKKEVLVRTSAGEFRFEGISDAFTKKLYEWETKRGVCPELSTIALLDSSLGPTSKPSFTIQQAEKCSLLHRAMSRSESSLPEIGQPSHTSSNSLPSLKPPDSGDMERIHLQSRASSEPDLTSLSAIANNNRNGICLTPYENVSVADAFPKEEENSKNSMCDLDKNPNESYSPTGVTQLIDSYTEAVGEEERRDEAETEQREENYYSLLEENVILLEQLKKKEDICRRLEKELELLDEKVDEMNSHHQKEMERYREKLWEMHRPGTTPREAQGCLQIISELRTRIEELEKCSERLRNDRDTIEDSFRYHSEQQEHMTLDLLGKMRELQAAGGSPISDSAHADDSEFKRSKRKLLPILDMKIVDKLQNLSAQLVKQTTHLENTLAERTRQICKLRWELLHRDVSTVKLETELHTAHIQGAQHPCRAKCEAKRSKYAHFRSWSSEEASSRKKHQEERYPEFDRLVHQSQEVYSHLPKSEFQATDLSCTVHELSKELLRLSTAAESLLTASEDEDQQDKLTPAKTENAVQRIKLSESETKTSAQVFAPTISCEPRCEVDGTQGRRRSDSICSSQITVRRNSAENISSVSGPDVSETSSINEAADKSAAALAAGRTLSPKRRVSSSSSSAEESSEGEKFSSVSCCPNKDRTIALQGREMVLKRVASRKDKKRVDSSKDKGCGKYRNLDKRVTNSDSKIPVSHKFNIVKSGSVGSYDRGKKEVHPADRSLSTREKRELFASKREHVLRRRLKPPPLEIKMVENSIEPFQWNKSHLKFSNDNVQEKITPTVNEIENSRCLSADNDRKNSGSVDSRSSSSADRNVKIVNDGSSSAIVTVKLPRRKPKMTPKKGQNKSSGRQNSSLQLDTNQGKKKIAEATVTVVLPTMKRSVDRQLPKRSSTDGDIRELVIRENFLAPQSNVLPCNATCDGYKNGSPYENDNQHNKKDVISQSTNVQNSNISPSQTNTLDCGKGNTSNVNTEYINEFSLHAKLHDSALTYVSEAKTDKEVASESLITQGREAISNVKPSSKTESSATDVRQECLRPGYFKSPSAPQLSWKLGCARKISREGAPNVRCLIEKYNQKAMESQSPKSPRSPVYNSAIPIRKISAMDWRNHQQPAHIPLTPTNASFPNPSLGSSSSVIYRSHDMNELSTSLHSPPLSPPTSPASRARAEALHKAKENFMSSSVSPITTQPIREEDEKDKSFECIAAGPTNQISESKTKPNSGSAPDDDRVSSSSTRSMDSTSLVVYRTGASCQENRLARKMDLDKQKTDTEKTEGNQKISTQSISTPSISKTVAGYEFKLPTSLMNLKLRRSKRKKDLATVSELCRQSLLITKEEEDVATVNTSEDVNTLLKSPRSCPSSPELKSKSKPKTSWLQWSILKHK